MAEGDALVIVDVQNDFLPGGALGVPEGDQVIEPLSRCARAFERRNRPVFATRDWHPADHCSFRAQGGPWPPHCIQGTHGAEFASALYLPRTATIISKATRAEADAYSGFQGTDLEKRLRDAGCRRVFIGGLATDYCVRATALDARNAGFDVVVLADAVRAVNAEPGDDVRALGDMSAAGAAIGSVEQLLASEDGR